jgi:hypothetical protein
MIKKNLAILFFMGLSLAVHAQAITKMEINVRVKSGATIRYSEQMDVEFTGFADNNPSVFRSEKEIEFITRPNHEFIILQPEIAELQNEYGEGMIIKSQVLAEGDPGHGKYLLQISSAVDFEKTPRGTFMGNHSTSIEYL